MDFRSRVYPYIDPTIIKPQELSRDYEFPARKEISDDCPDAIDWNFLSDFVFGVK
jgi:hypothetical protein